MRPMPWPRWPFEETTSSHQHQKARSSDLQRNLAGKRQRAMSLHLAEIFANIASRCPAVLLLDQPGWRMSGRLVVPDNITLLPPPPKCPELIPAENFWHYMRDNMLSNWVFTSYEEIVDHCCNP
jgi:transposase